MLHAYILTYHHIFFNTIESSLFNNNLFNRILSTKSHGEQERQTFKRFPRVSQKSHCSAKTVRLRRPKMQRKSLTQGLQRPPHALSLFGLGGEHIARHLTS